MSSWGEIQAEAARYTKYYGAGRSDSLLSEGLLLGGGGGFCSDQNGDWDAMHEGYYGA